MIAISKELNELYKKYTEYKAGNKEALSELYTVKEGKVTLDSICLRKLINSLRTSFEREEMNTKYTHKKYYPGLYDTSDLESMINLLLVEIFEAETDSTGCITVNGVRSKKPIVDGESLIRNLSFFADSEMNLFGKVTFFEKSKEDIDTREHQEVISKREAGSKRIHLGSYRECSGTKDIVGSGEMYDLFNTISSNVLAVLFTLLKAPEVFEKCENDMKLVEQEKICKIIEDYTGVHIWKNNLSTCFNTIESNLLDYTYICQSRHKYVFGIDDTEIYRLCQLSNAEEFIKQLRRHEDSLYNMKFTDSEKKLIFGESIEPEKIEKLQDKILKKFESKERLFEEKLTETFELENDFVKKSFNHWNSNINKKSKYLKLYLYSREDIKHPIEKKIDIDDLIVLDGFEKFWVCDQRNNKCYILPKKLRKKFKIKMRKVA